jgi:two-component system KDP operon response regulator KdpE
MRVALRHRGTRAAAGGDALYAAATSAVDLATPRVTRGGQPVHLTPTEFKLLARLVRRPARW